MPLCYLQKLCYNDIRNYKSVNGITYQCTACNVAGSIYATFTSIVSKFRMFCNTCVNYINDIWQSFLKLCMCMFSELECVAGGLRVRKK